MKAVLLIDFGSTYTKVTAVDVEGGVLLGTADSFTTIQTDIGEGLANALEKLHSKKASNCLDLLLPKSMIEVMLKEWGIDTEKTTNQITKEERMVLVKLLKGFKIPLL